MHHHPAHDKHLNMLHFKFKCTLFWGITHTHTHTHQNTRFLPYLLITVFLNCLHTFSESMPHILRTLHTNPKKHTQWAKPLNSPEISFFQNETLHSKQCYFFSKWDFVFKWHTQTIICIDIYKNQLNTDVLNVKHYDGCKTLLLHSS